MEDSPRGAPEMFDALVVEPEPETREVLAGLLGQERRTEWRQTAAEGREFLRRHAARLFICADDLPDFPGLMLMAETADLHPSMQRILLCRDLDAELLLHAMKSGSIFHYLPKPLDREAAAHLIEHSLRQNRLFQDLLSTRRMLDRAEAMVASPLGGDDLSRRRLTLLALRGYFLVVFGILVLVALVLLCFVGVYLLKSYLGFDLFPSRHLEDILMP